MSDIAADALDSLARLPRGVRLVIADSHDVTGGNDDGFRSTWSYLHESPDGWVLFDHEGPGVVLLVRTIGFVTSLLAFVDDEPEPRLCVPFPELYGGGHPAFPAHLVADEDAGHGSAWSFAPIPFRTRCRIVAPEKHASYHFFNIWAHVFDRPEQVDAFDPRPLDAALWRDPDIPPDLTGLEVLRGTASVASFGRTVLVERDGPGVVRWLTLRLPPAARVPDVLAEIRLRAWWDDRPYPDVEAPIGLFFAAGYRDEERIARTPPYRIVFGGQPMDIASGFVRPRGIPAGERDDGTYYCRFPMPFWSAARIELASLADVGVEGIAWEVAVADNPPPAAETGYFVASYRREDGTLPHRDYIVAEMRGRGKYVGCAMRMSSRRVDREGGVVRHFLEGDARFYVDDSRAFACGSTGTEEYFNWGWYDVLPKDVPFAFPSHGYSEHARDAHDHSTMYRFHVSDPVPYERAFRFALEHGPEGEIPSDYASVAFLYHRDEPSLALTDSLDVGDPEDERAHGYVVDGVAWEGRRTLVHEGNDQVLDRLLRARGESWERVAGITDDGRAWTGSCAFTVTIRGANDGVRIRCRHDGEWPPGEVLSGMRTRIVAAQEAIVLVDGIAAGRWYRPARHARRTWMEDEFDIPAALTAGKDRIRIALRNARPGESTWNDYRYGIFSRTF